MGDKNYRQEAQVILSLLLVGAASTIWGIWMQFGPAYAAIVFGLMAFAGAILVFKL